MKDILNLQASCKEFCRASMEKTVRHLLVVNRDWTLRWWEKDAYMGLLRECAGCGNLNAEFLLGLEELYNSRNAMLGLQHLQRAMDGGHITAAYLLGVVLFRSPAMQSYAMEILNKVSSRDLSAASDVTKCTRSGNHIVNKCRKAVLQTIRKSWKKEWGMKLGLPCDDQHCGEGWVLDDCLPRSFCSQDCQWRYEAEEFFANI
jgi:hypothetical protein